MINNEEFIKTYCMASSGYNVFGCDTEDICCYKYHKYCKDVTHCMFKFLIKQLECKDKYVG